MTLTDAELLAVIRRDIGRQERFIALMEAVMRMGFKPRDIEPSRVHLYWLRKAEQELVQWLALQN